MVQDYSKYVNSEFWVDGSKVGIFSWNQIQELFPHWNFNGDVMIKPTGQEIIEVGFQIDV